MRSDSVPALPAIASESFIGFATSLRSIAASRSTTSCGVVRFCRLSPEPSTICGRAPSLAAWLRATAVPAEVVPPLPKSAPRSLSSVSAMKDRKSTRLNSSHVEISYAVFCLKKKTVGAEGEGMVAGDLVNTASRIQSVAQPGSVFVGEGTRRATEQAIAYERAGEHELRGKQGQTALWRAQRVVSARRGELKSDGLEAPFVGRDRELRLFILLFRPPPKSTLFPYTTLFR